MSTFACRKQHLEQRTNVVDDWFILTCYSLPPKYAVIFADKEYETMMSDVTKNGCTMHQSSPTEDKRFVATLIGNERVTATDHWQDVRLLTFDIAGSQVT